MSLPPELRNHIYGVLLQSSQPVRIHATERVDTTQPRHRLPDILHANQVLRKEALAMYFSINTFQICNDDWPLQNEFPWTTLEKWLEVQVTTRNIAHLSAVTIYTLWGMDYVFGINTDRSYFRRSCARAFFALKRNHLLPDVILQKSLWNSSSSRQDFERLHALARQYGHLDSDSAMRQYDIWEDARLSGHSSRKDGLIRLE